MEEKKPTIQEWNLAFLKEHLERISTQNQYNEIDRLNLVDNEAIVTLYNDLAKEDNQARIQNGEYPTINTKYHTINNHYTKFNNFDCKSQETENEYIVEINHKKIIKLKSVCNDPYTYIENKFKHILVFDKKKYNITLETQIKLEGADDLQPATFSTFSFVNGKTFKKEWERLSTEDNEYQEEEKQFIQAALPDTKILKNAFRYNYGYDHWYNSPSGIIRIYDVGGLYYAYNHFRKNNKYEEIEYYLRIEANPQKIKIEKSYQFPNEEVKHYTSYEEFFEDVEELAKDDELLLVLRNEVKKLQQLNLCATFSSPEKAPQKVLQQN